jgi:hypothetical protein
MREKKERGHSFIISLTLFWPRGKKKQEEKKKRKMKSTRDFF